MSTFVKNADGSGYIVVCSLHTLLLYRQINVCIFEYSEACKSVIFKILPGLILFYGKPFYYLLGNVDILFIY